MKKKIAYLGPKGTFSYEVCNKIYKEEVEKIPYNTIKNTITSLNKKLSDEAVVPIENSLQGCVTETLDTLIENENIYIKEEKILKIKHNLMTNKNNNIEDIKEIYSHPQALAQCREYIDSNFKNVEIIEVSSTAKAAEKIKGKENAACIGNIECQREYDLKILKKNIQDNDFNETKFWVLTNKPQDNKNAKLITIVFSTDHKPGALYHILGIFNRYNLNLSKIESRPTKTKLGKYYFWIDIEIKNKDYTKALEELKKNVSFYRVLGKY